MDSIYAPIKVKDEEVKKELENGGYSIVRNQKVEQVRAYRIVAMLGLSTSRRFTE